MVLCALTPVTGSEADPAGAVPMADVGEDLAPQEARWGRGYGGGWGGRGYGGGWGGRGYGGGWGGRGYGGRGYGGGWGGRGYGGWGRR